MVAGGLEGVGETGQGTAGIVLDGRGLAVDRLSAPHHQAAEGLGQALVAEADAQDRHPPGQLLDGPGRDAGLTRRARPRRDDQGPVARQLVDPDGVVAVDVDLGAQLGEALDQVVGEGVVVVDHGHGAAHGIASASATAWNMAPAFSKVSWYSRLGSESATTPAPACR